MSRRAAFPFATILALCWVGSANADAASSTVYVARRGWHIDIGMAIADLAPSLNQVVPDLPGARYVFFGFADKHYLLAAKHNAPVLLSALWPGAGIVLATGLPNSPAEAFGEKHVIALSVQAEQMRDLQSFIWRALRTQDEVLTVYQQGPYDGSVYFLARPKYSAFRTCNTWGADALRAAGFHVHVKGVVFAWQLWAQARRLKRAQENPPAMELPCSAPHMNSRVDEFSSTTLLARRCGSVLADDRGGRSRRHDDGGLGRRIRAAAADAAAQHRRDNYERR